MRREVIADGVTVDGRHFEMVELTHEREVPGVGKQSYAVDVAANGDLGPISVGFISEREARRYLTTYGDVECTAVDTNNDKVKITRFGLGVPSGMFRDRREVTEESTAAPKAAKPVSNDDRPSRRGRNTPSGSAPVSGASSSRASSPAGGASQTTNPVNNAPTQSGSGS